MQRLSDLGGRLADWLLPDEARTLLQRKVRGEIDFLDRLTGSTRLSHTSVCAALSASYGYDLLFDANMRKALIARLPAELIDELWSAFEGEFGRLADGIKEKRNRLATIALHRGSYRARRFCEALRLPYECAGQWGGATSQAFEEFPPRIELPPLHDYQIELSSSIRNELLEHKADRRGMLALPTGGGKTRVVLETILNWAPVESGTTSLLWVAQHEELCEQAIECVSQLWASKVRPSNRSIRIQRVWGGKSEELDWSADVLVGIPESLLTRVMADAAAAARRLGLIVIDEAHLAVSKIYDPIFRLASVCRVPVLGVTATPANLQDRSGVLQQCFDRRLISSNVLGRQPYAVLRERGVLSDVEFESIESGVTVVLSGDEREDLREPFADYGKAVLGTLGRNAARNRLIVQRLASVATGTATLAFTSSVDSAHALAAAMAIIGRTAAAVDASTPRTVRKRILSDFKAGNVEFLFNFGVLAVGFDAPKIECLLIARPTRSAVLLEQMVGRGLRGPLNGGTPTCMLLWVEDDFSNAEELRPQSYQRFAKLWKANDA